MPPRRAWCLITAGRDRQYGGNTGYDDDPKAIYRYDSSVANHKQLSVRDLILVRDKKRLLGIARIKRIDRKSELKTRQRCPSCRTVAIKERTSRAPRWRCKNGHEFSEPAIEEIMVEAYSAQYGETFVDARDAIPVSAIKSAAPRPSDQLSIEEIDIGRFEDALLDRQPAAQVLIADFIVSIGLDEEDKRRVQNKSEVRSDYEPNMAERRDLVLRAIRQRRGQARFRRSLIERYGPRCMISGCDLLQIVEAAHIWPHRGEEDNHVRNGLLLRADLHTLFDLNILAIEPESLGVRLAEPARHSTYAQFEGKCLKTPVDVTPSRPALRLRWASFGDALDVSSRIQR